MTFKNRLLVLRIFGYSAGQLTQLLPRRKGENSSNTGHVEPHASGHRRRSHTRGINVVWSSASFGSEFRIPGVFVILMLVLSLSLTSVLLAMTMGEYAYLTSTCEAVEEANEQSEVSFLSSCLSLSQPLPQMHTLYFPASCFRPQKPKLKTW